MFGRKLINLSHVISVQLFQTPCQKKGKTQTANWKTKIETNWPASSKDMGSRHGHGHGHWANFAALQAPNF